MKTKSEANERSSLTGKCSWVQSLANIIKRTDHSAESGMRTMLYCDIQSSKPALFVPPDMAELQPQSLRYLHAFSQANDLKLIEDRRRVMIQPIIEQREQKPPMIAAGLSMLLKQTGMPGNAKALSCPHRLNADSPHIGISRLIEMAAFATPNSKRIVVLPNRMIVNILDNDTHPISAYGCKLISADTTTILSHFDSPNFRAIGYSAGNQYVLHICLAGGPLTNPTLWTHLRTLTRTDFRFQLLPNQTSINDFGLFYATFYMDMADSDAPWWLSTEPDTHQSNEDNPLYSLRQQTG